MYITRNHNVVRTIIWNEIIVVKTCSPIIHVCLPCPIKRNQVISTERMKGKQIESGSQAPSPLDIKSYSAVGKGVPFIAQASSSISLVLSGPDSLLLFMLPHFYLT